MQIQEVVSLLDRLGARLVVFLCHHNADPDAICAAYALSQLMKRLKDGLEIEIAAAQGPSKLSKQILNVLPVKLVDYPRIEEADALVLLDTNTIQQLDEWKPRIEKSGKPLIVIDHHAAHPETKKISTLCVADEEASSTCEIVYTLFKEVNVKPVKGEALALFLGMAYDTKHFILASSKTFKVASELIESGVRAEEALSLLATPIDLSERIARLKAAERSRLIKMGDWIVVSSHVSAYQASAARALLSIGAHVAIVGGMKESVIRISLRACKQFYEGTGIHLGRDIARPLGEYVHGMGGGHSTSAGVNGKGDLDDALKRCVRLLREKIKV